jgi:hypothetical protein
MLAEMNSPTLCASLGRVRRRDGGNEKCFALLSSAVASNVVARAVTITSDGSECGMGFAPFELLAGHLGCRRNGH